jgi:hypothetical protein
MPLFEELRHFIDWGSSLSYKLNDWYNIVVTVFFVLHVLWFQHQKTKLQLLPKNFMLIL